METSSWTTNTTGDLLSSPVPVVLRKRLRRQHPSASSAPLDELLTGRLSSVITTWRVSPISPKQTVREYECVFVTASFYEFNQWLNNEVPPRSSSLSVTNQDQDERQKHPFAAVPPFHSNTVSVYADYKHYRDLFTDEECQYAFSGSWMELLAHDRSSNISSSQSTAATSTAATAPTGLGMSSISSSSSASMDLEMEEDSFLAANVVSLPQRAGAIFSPSEQTLWLGTRGAHTPLHYDTYGCNIVQQVIGSKRWRLWPPTARSPCSSQSSPSSPSPSSPPCLRIPYEESSVYSSYDPRATNQPGNIPAAFDVTLEEGDVLFVPKHYWHFVETVSEIAFSVNLWIPVPVPPNEVAAACPGGSYGEKDRQDEAMCSAAAGGHATAAAAAAAAVTGSVLQVGLTASTSTSTSDPAVPVSVPAFYGLVRSDRRDRAVEAATRLLFGAVKGALDCAAARVRLRLDESGPGEDDEVEFEEGDGEGETDDWVASLDVGDPRRGWLSPSEAGGSLDLDLPLSSGLAAASNPPRQLSSQQEGREIVDHELHLKYLLAAVGAMEEEVEKPGAKRKSRSPPDAETFLKRFVSALLDPSNVERCLSEACGV